MEVINQADKMMKKIISTLLLVSFVGCKNANQSIENSVEVENIETLEKDNSTIKNVSTSSCFEEEEITKLRSFLKNLEIDNKDQTLIELSQEYRDDLKKRYSDKTCQAREKLKKKSCDTLLYFFDCREIFNDGEEEHIVESAYWYHIVKKNSKVKIVSSGGAG